jgi:hypothetical protein
MPVAVRVQPSFGSEFAAICGFSQHAQSMAPYRTFISKLSRRHLALVYLVDNFLE